MQKNEKMQKVATCRWTLDALYDNPDLLDQLMREGVAIAWEELNQRALRRSLLRALELNPKIKKELEARTSKNLRSLR
jgi:hypothetical protein